MAKMYEYEGLHIIVSETSDPPVKVYSFGESGMTPLYETTSLDLAMRWIDTLD